MTSREELIEEAAKAMVERASGETWEDCNQAWYLADAHVAFAVFEKAQAPTDDEREALTRAIDGQYFCPVEEGGTYGSHIDLDVHEARVIADAVLAAGFRRPAQTERSPEFNSLEQELFKHQPVLSMRDGSIAGCQCLDRVFHKDAEDWGTHLTEVFESLHPAQTEPTDARIAAMTDPNSITDEQADAAQLAHYQFVFGEEGLPNQRALGIGRQAMKVAISEAVRAAFTAGQEEQS